MGTKTKSAGVQIEDGIIKVIDVKDEEAIAHTVVVMGERIKAFYRLSHVVLYDAEKDEAKRVLSLFRQEYTNLLDQLSGLGFDKFWLWVDRKITIDFQKKGEIPYSMKDEIKKLLPDSCELSEFYIGYYTSWGSIVCR